MISIARIFGAPESVPAGRQARSASIAPTSVAQRAGDRRDDVHHVRVGLDRHQLVDLDACRTRRRGRGRCGRGRRASRARRAPSRRPSSSSATLEVLAPGSSPRGRVPAIGRMLGAAAARPSRSGSGEAPAIAKSSKSRKYMYGRRVDGAQAAVDRERLDRAVGRSSAATARPGRCRRRGCTPWPARRPPRTRRAPCSTRTRPRVVGRGRPAGARDRRGEQLARALDQRRRPRS